MREAEDLITKTRILLEGVKESIEASMTSMTSEVTGDNLETVRKFVLDAPSLLVDLCSALVAAEARSLATAAAVCNRCGEDRCILVRGDDRGHYGVEVRFSSGYDSPVLEDGYYYEFALCEPCVAGVMAEFKIPPTKTDYMIRRTP